MLSLAMPSMFGNPLQFNAWNSSETMFREQLLLKTGVLIEDVEGEGDGDNNVEDYIGNMLQENSAIKISMDTTDIEDEELANKIEEWVPSTLEMAAILIHYYIITQSNEMIKLNGFLDSEPIASKFEQRLPIHFRKWSDNNTLISFRYQCISGTNIDYLHVKFAYESKNVAQMYCISESKKEMLEIINIDLPEDIKDF